MPDCPPTPDAVQSARERMFSALTSRPVPVEGFPDLFARKWTAGDRVEFHRAHKDDAEPDLFARMFVYTACDSTGARLFTVEDMPAIRDTFDGEAVEAVVKLSLGLNGIAADTDPKA